MEVFNLRSSTWYRREEKRGGACGEKNVLFTNNDKIVEEERNNLLYCGRREQNVLCINERQVMEGGSVMQETMRGVGAYTSSKKKNGGRDQPRPKTSWKK